MKDSLYKGNVRFDREQLVFVVEAVLIGALDKIEHYLPTGIASDREYLDRAAAADGDRIAGIYAPLEAAGMTLGVLYAQLTDDSLGVYDALSTAGDFHKVVELMVATAWQDFGEHVYAAMDARQRYRIEDVLPGYPHAAHAEMFVSRLFDVRLDPAGYGAK